MKHHPRFGATLLLGALLCASASSARAQSGAPDLSDFSGAIAERADAAVPAKLAPTPKTGFVSGLAVPRVKPGKAASAVFSVLVDETEKAGATQPEMLKMVPVLKDLEKQAPALLSAIEKEMPKMGLAPRDMGSAYAVAFLALHEGATGKKTTPVQDKAAGRIMAMATAKTMGDHWKKMPPQARELAYEALIMTTAFSSLLIDIYSEAGRNDELPALRQAASERFKQLVGVPAEDVTIAANGDLTFAEPAEETAETPEG